MAAIGLISPSPAAATAQAGGALSWGCRGAGQLGDGTTSTSPPVFALIPEGTTVVDVSAGYGHSLALTSTGAVLAWGGNDEGQLGIGTVGISRSTPVPVEMPEGTIVTAIAPGGSHSLALTSTGSVLAWGGNSDGELGGGTNYASDTPVAVDLPEGTTVTAIAADGDHSLALTSTGSVLAWGDNANGQLGDGTNEASNTPVAVDLPEDTTVTAIAAGSVHSLALTSTGSVLAWGDNRIAGPDPGTYEPRNTPLAVELPEGTTTVAVAAGLFHSLALTSSGSVLAWGENFSGQLGDGTHDQSDTPVTVDLPEGTTVATIATGAGHSLALTSTGEMLAWGANYSGELGDGTQETGYTPVTVDLPEGTTVTAIGVGEGFSVALSSLGSILAWGGRGYGQLGDGVLYFDVEPSLASVPQGVAVTTVAAGKGHSLALTSTGSVMAWGGNATGQLGDGTDVSSNIPVAVDLPEGTTINAISAGSFHSLAVTSSGSVLAWGDNRYGQLGEGTNASSSTPVTVDLPEGTTVTALAAADIHSLALTSTGSVLAWGANFGGQLGNGTSQSSDTPVAVDLPEGTTVTAVAAGARHSLALTSTGSILAWGSNSNGRLGDGSFESSKVPVGVNLPNGTSATAIAAGGYHSLALTSTGSVLAWGYNAEGELGDGTYSDRRLPVTVDLPEGTTATALAAGDRHSLALTSTGSVLGWGRNDTGQLGDGTTTTTSTPVRANLPAGVTASAVSAGECHSLAVTVAERPGATGDYDGNGTTDIAVYRPASATWYVEGRTEPATSWGLGADIPVPGDYDGDGMTDLAVFRPGENVWYIKTATAESAAHWGASGDIPVPGDYDGDGLTDLAVFRPGENVWYVKTATTESATYWGASGDIPVPADYDGDGLADLAVFRPDENVWYVKTATTESATYWGASADIPVPGDYDGDGMTDLAVFRPDEHVWHVKTATNETGTYWGASGDIPVPGDYDGDGLTDLAVFRPGENVWYVKTATTESATYWGASGDIPVVRPAALRG